MTLDTVVLSPSSAIPLAFARLADQGSLSGFAVRIQLKKKGCSLSWENRVEHNARVLDWDRRRFRIPAPDPFEPRSHLLTSPWKGTRPMTRNLREDPLVRSVRREAAVVAIVGVGATVYTLTYCGLFGYDRAGEPIRFVLGFPEWVFWGIVVPWVACVGICGWFSWWFMRDDDLGEESEAAVDE